MSVFELERNLQIISDISCWLPIQIRYFIHYDLKREKVEVLDIDQKMQVFFKIVNFIEKTKTTFSFLVSEVIKLMKKLQVL